jgi:transposase InsO family protein
VFSNRIVGWAIDERMKARLVVAAIEMAVVRRGDVAGCILHSDSEYVGAGCPGRRDPHSDRRVRMSGASCLRAA